MVVGIRLWHHSIPLRNALIAVFIVAELFAWIRRFGAEFHRRDDAAHARRELSVSPPGVSVPASGLLLDLEAVRTEAPAGEVTVRLAARGRLRIIGPSGIGKSSLIEAALGLREPTGGRVERTDVPIGLVRADSRFLRASLRENLDPAGEHPDEDLRATLVIVGLSPSRFGDLDEVLNNEDASMSSGERVQLAIARSLLATVSLLVLDDVGGLLDEPTRARLAAAIDERPEMAVLEAGHDRFLVEGTEVLELVVAP
jgi:ABC-type transport system involved in cytochrome bd biosynthesis fused ATPase/permease subunit